jgi:acyl-CoA synthetase (AMP-forming)/AMP-acid ligase II/acyl carrier protein
MDNSRVKFSTMSTSTIPQRIHTIAGQSPDTPAILSLTQEPITYDRLFRQILHTVEGLNQLGIGRGDRVAIVIPNGPEMAVAFLCVAACGVSAPLNPNYRDTEFDFFLKDLNAAALLVIGNLDSTAVAVAQRAGIPILRMKPAETGSDILFNLSGETKLSPKKTGITGLDDEALILHTSGTTSRPKMVPLTHRNLSASATNISQVLQLTRGDRCLSIMPLFHIHGLMASLCASLVAGGSVVCTPGFYAPQFFDWVGQFQPTWYSAVPTMHQSILERASTNQAVLDRVQLRFLRSSSAPLPPRVMAELELVFRAPLIEAYGMTEAAHQIASNPLPPLPRKPGSVGLPAGPELAIMNEDGSSLLPRGQIGEIVLRGENILSGYSDHAEANEKAFTEGWFRTGDLGSIDPDGYVFITGRSKEIINRGGEKISPREIDEILLEHPAVAQAMTFAIPDTKLGEDIAAAVVLRQPGATEKELRHFLGQRLSAYKLPVKIVFLEEIPKGPTGKPQRIGMAQNLGLDVAPAQSQFDTEPFVTPQTASEKKLAEIWCDVLKLEYVSINQPFLKLGGDSMTAMQLANRVCEWVGSSVSLIDFFEARTINAQAAMIDQMISERKT